jgi:molybdate transport system substrate-binding protein
MRKCGKFKRLILVDPGVIVRRVSTTTTGSGASQGSGPQTIGVQLASGVAADVVILSREGLEELVAAKRIAAGTEVDLARVGLGVAVRAGTSFPV